MTSQSAVDVAALLSGAQDDGLISAASANVLGNIDLGAQIQAGLGVNVDDVTASEVVLVTVMPDDSGSIRMAGNAQLVRDGHNELVIILEGSKQAGDVLFHTRYLNGDVLNPYMPLDQVEQMDATNYNPNRGTPLHKQSVVLLGTVITKAQQFADNGVPVRTITVIITDGGDTDYDPHGAANVKKVVDDMFTTENHIVAGVGLSDGSTDFNAVFAEMGIPSEWRLVAGQSEQEIRRVFALVSRSVAQFSQGLAVGGFGTP